MYLFTNTAVFLTLYLYYIHTYIHSIHLLKALFYKVTPSIWIMHALGSKHANLFCCQFHSNHFSFQSICWPYRSGLVVETSVSSYVEARTKRIIKWKEEQNVKVLWSERVSLFYSTV